jgi:hypothetical protein
LFDVSISKDATATEPHAPEEPDMYTWYYRWYYNPCTGYYSYYYSWNYWY